MRTTICKLLDCSQTQLRNYLDEHPDLKQVMLDARESVLDFAERVIWENLIQKKDPYLRQKAAEFTLKTIGRHRGWGIADYCQGMRVDVDTSSDKDVKVSIQGIFGITE